MAKKANDKSAKRQADAKGSDSLKLSTPADLSALKAKAVSQLDLRSGPKDLRITVHMGTCGIAAGAREIMMELVRSLPDEAQGRVSIQQAGCAGLCDREPMITLTDKAGQEFCYGPLTARKVRQIIDQHVLKGVPVTECLLNQ